MSSVFISYRRSDAAPYAGRLHDRLTAAFGDDKVFMDLEIKPGDDFVDRIDEGVGSCDVLLVLIGPSWLEAKDDQNRRRLDDPDDFARVELHAALQRGIRVIPVLVGGSVMPSVKDLPEELATLGRKQALELSDTRFRTDADRLIEVIEAEFELRAEDEGARELELRQAAAAEAEEARAEEAQAEEAQAEEARRAEERRLAEAEKPAPPPTPPVRDVARTGGESGNRRAWVALAGVGAIALVVAAVVLVGGGDTDGEADSSEAASSTYPADFVANFMRSCTRSSESEAADAEDICRCILDRVERTVPYEDFVEIDSAVRERGLDAAPPELRDVSNECAKSVLGSS